jgi:hypothetical protein
MDGSIANTDAGSEARTITATIDRSHEGCDQWQTFGRVADFASLLGLLLTAVIWLKVRSLGSYYVRQALFQKMLGKLEANSKNINNQNARQLATKLRPELAKIKANAATLKVQISKIRSTEAEELRKDLTGLATLIATAEQTANDATLFSASAGVESALAGVVQAADNVLSAWQLSKEAK